MTYFKQLTLTSLLFGTIASANASLVTVVDQSPKKSSVETISDPISKADEQKDYDSLSYKMPNTALNLKRDHFYDYLNLKTTRSARLHVKPDGTIVFIVRPETLEQNVRTLLGHTKGAVLWVEPHFPKALRMFNTFEVQGNDVLEVLDQLIAPFYATRNVIGEYHPNNVVRLTIAE